MNFPNQFLPNNSKTDPHILDKLTTKENLSGMLNWALEGLQRLLKNGKFSYSLSTEETRDLYTKNSDTARYFVETCLDINPQIGIVKPRLYDVYKLWCIEERLAPVSKQSFTKRLIQYVPEIQTMRPRVDGKMITCWLGIEFNERAARAKKGIR